MHWRVEMPRAVETFAPMPTFKAAAEKPVDRPLDPIILFSGIGLLAFLIAILTGVQGVWY
jgi:hypothetical protein